MDAIEPTDIYSATYILRSTAVIKSLKCSIVATTDDSTASRTRLACVCVCVCVCVSGVCVCLVCVYVCVWCGVFLCVCCL